MQVLINKKQFFQTYKSINYANRSWDNYSYLFPIKPSQELAEITADLLTDGAMDIRPRLKSMKYNYIAFFSKHNDELIRFNKNLYKLFKVKGRLTKKWGVNHYGKSQGCIVVNSTITRIMNLCGVPFGRKTNISYDIPKWISKGNLDIQRAFLRRSFTCEGSISYDKNSKRWEIRYPMYKLANLSDSNKKYLNSLKGMLSNFNINASNNWIKESYIRKIDRKLVEGYYFRISEKESMGRFCKNINFDLEYKQKRLNKAIQSFS
ncbi:hypothetical protein HYX17_02260 [Candidatus Woesearchaeota archaeon]|nr:hypothetical protein [Candidatus Woesearchaeota archaeon]